MLLLLVQPHPQPGPRGGLVLQRLRQAAHLLREALGGRQGPWGPGLRPLPEGGGTLGDALGDELSASLQVVDGLQIVGAHLQERFHLAQAGGAALGAVGVSMAIFRRAN